MLPAAVYAIVILCWLIFALAFLFRKRPPHASQRKSERTAFLGILLEGLGYALVWFVRRSRFTPLVSMNVAIEIAVAAITVLIAVGSVWLVLTAVRTLGKEWSLAARIVEGHRLVREGPYGIVRHPIYSGMFGMLVATGLALSHWGALIAAMIMFWFGTNLRIKVEEGLLRDEFGEEFDMYVRKVPALLPTLRR
jgi:protein-S-isoprenylcysteine O-methyltransferase Ste14